MKKKLHVLYISSLFLYYVNFIFVFYFYYIKICLACKLPNNIENTLEHLDFATYIADGIRFIVMKLILINNWDTM